MSSDRSSSERSSPLDAAELLRDAPLYPPLRDEHYIDTDDHIKLSNEEINEKTTNLDPDFINDRLQPFFDTHEFNDDDSVENKAVNEVTGVDYEDLETNIEDSSMLVTPDEPSINESNVNLGGKIFEVPKESDEESKYSDINLDNSNITPDDYNDFTENFSQDLNEKTQGNEYNEESTKQYLESNDVKDTNNGFIVAPANNIDELNRILREEEARVEAENKKNTSEEQFVDESIVENDKPDDVLSPPEEDSFDRKKRSSGQEWEKTTKVNNYIIYILQLK